jgi:N-acetylneuraminate synthase
MLSKPFVVDEREFGAYNPFIIAEIGVNHEGDLLRAKKLIESAAGAGAHAVKFQTYTAQKLASTEFSPAYWDLNKEPEVSQFQLFQRYKPFNKTEYGELADTAKEFGVHFMSTPFDEDSLRMIEPLMPVIKIASADLTNVPLLTSAAKLGKPIILSTGASNLDEISSSADLLISLGVPQLALLHCVLQYPTPNSDANLAVITTLQERFGRIVSVGYSDHVSPSLGGELEQLEIAFLLGATVIEKHFTDSPGSPGNDHYHSTDGFGLAQTIKKFQEFRIFLGSGVADLEGQQTARNNARRRVFSTRAIVLGSQLTEGDIIPLRSNVGVEVSDWGLVLGAKANKDIEQGAPILLEDLTLNKIEE